MVQSNQKGINIYAKAISSAFGLIYLMDSSFSLPTIAYILVFFSTTHLFQQVQSKESPRYWQSNCVGLIFTLFVILGEKWLDPLFDSFTVNKLLCLVIASIWYLCFLSAVVKHTLFPFGKGYSNSRTRQQKAVFLLKNGVYAQFLYVVVCIFSVFLKSIPRKFKL